MKFSQNLYTFMDNLIDNVKKKEKVKIYIVLGLHN